jgi:16S rRNA (guanine966-N2)-methyltransferase
MRVIGGEFRSRRLKSIPGDATRPTPDRLRETLFEYSGAAHRGRYFLDAYAGTGAVGIEALSRGAQHSARFDPGEAHGDLRRTRLVKQGDNALSFYALDMQL